MNLNHDQSYDTSPDEGDLEGILDLEEDISKTIKKKDSLKRKINKIDPNEFEKYLIFRQIRGPAIITSYVSTENIEKIIDNCDSLQLPNINQIIEDFGKSKKYHHITNNPFFRLLSCADFYFRP